MHDIKSFTTTPLQKLKKLNKGDKIELLTFKKDRKILIIKKDLNLYKVIEDGFEHKEFDDIKYEKLDKLLKQLQRVEFPRSNKFYLKVITAPPTIEQISFGWD